MIFGTHDAKTLAQLSDVASRAVRVALMADGHLGYVMPIGGVAAYRNQVSIVGVGFDIACGNCAIQTNLDVGTHTVSELNELADTIQRTISFGVGRSNAAQDAPVDHPLFESGAWSALPKHERDRLRAKARDQLGTVGSGNHYVDVFAGSDGKLWVGVHFGSRGFGHTIASGFLALSQGAKWGTRVPEKEVLLDLDTQLGQDYWALMSLAGEYAYAGREWVTRKVVELLGGKEQLMVHNHHNFAWEEWHGGEELVVVRKGATPAFPGEMGFVGGSMGDKSVILQGTRHFEGVPAPITDEEIEAYLDSPAYAAYQRQAAAMHSTVHGAGRVMSRTEARGKVKGWGAKAQVVSPGKVTAEMLEGWLGPMGVLLRGGGLDEAPQAYRRLPDVLAAQGDTIEVLHELTPLIVVMAGANEFDPYKD